LFGDRKPPVTDVNWLADLGRADGLPRRAGALEVNSLQAMLIAIRSGLGIGAVPEYLVDHTEGMTRILPHARTPKIDMFFVYPEELRNSKRVGVFRDFLVSEIGRS
jgi:DNA-binding transcriptional LysR family regulator